MGLLPLFSKGTCKICIMQCKCYHLSLVKLQYWRFKCICKCKYMCQSICICNYIFIIRSVQSSRCNGTTSLLSWRRSYQQAQVIWIITNQNLFRKIRCSLIALSNHIAAKWKTPRLRYFYISPPWKMSWEIVKNMQRSKTQTPERRF